MSRRQLHDRNATRQQDRAQPAVLSERRRRGGRTCYRKRWRYRFLFSVFDELHRRLAAGLHGLRRIVVDCDGIPRRDPLAEPLTLLCDVPRFRQAQCRGKRCNVYVAQDGGGALRRGMGCCSGPGHHQCATQRRSCRAWSGQRRLRRSRRIAPSGGWREEERLALQQCVDARGEDLPRLGCRAGVAHGFRTASVGEQREELRGAGSEQPRRRDEQSCVRRSAHVQQQRRVPRAAHRTGAGHVRPEPNVAPIGRQLEERVAMHGKPGRQRERQEAERLAPQRLG